MSYPEITVIDMHTGGEPLRIVKNGYPPIPGTTILEKRRYVKENLDHLRKFLMFEPRGHADMYGALLFEPTHPQADLAVLFMHNEGYSTMCGHAIIALGRYAVDHGLVTPQEPVTKVNIECPCGLIRAEVQVKEGKSGQVSFESVPAFLHTADLTVNLHPYGKVLFDIAYGGAFYAIADACQFNLHPDTSPVRDLVDAATALSQAVKQAVTLTHPTEPDLAFLYGSILTDGNNTPGTPSKNICVFADAEVDRSPTGSGVTARMALRHAKNLCQTHQPATFTSLTGAAFTAQILTKTQIGPHPAVTVQVTGQAHYTGKSTYQLEEGDEIGKGFLLK